MIDDEYSDSINLKWWLQWPKNCACEYESQKIYS